MIHAHEAAYEILPPLNQLRTSAGDEPEQMQHRRAMSDPAALTILFVDDAPVTRSVYQQQLEEQGYRVLLAESAAQAKRIVQREKPQLAIIDYYMPDQNGDELTRDLLNEPESRDLLIVIHSQYPDALERSLEAGAVDFIYKEEPIDIFLLRIRSLHKYLRARQEQEQQKLQQERQEREYVENILATLTDGLIITDAEGAIDLINPAACALLGWEMEELQGRRLVELVSPPEYPLLQGEIEDRQRLQALHDRNPEGFWPLMDYALLPLVAVNGDNERVWASPRAKQLLQEGEKVLRYRSTGAHEITLQTALGTVTLRLVADPQQEDLREILRLAPYGGVIDQVQQSEQRELIDRQGELIPVVWSGALLRTPQFSIRGALFSLRDRRPELSQEQQRLSIERERQHAQKMASIGTLAGGIAHEFNNMLQPIMGFSALLLEQETEQSRLPEKDLERLQLIHSSAKRGSALVRQILDFSRKDQDLPEEVQSLDDLLKMALKMVQAALPPEVSLRQRLAPDLGSILINSTAFHQLLLNLCSNAAQSIQAAAVKEGKVVVLASTNFEQCCCTIRVEDNGEGVEEALSKKIFDPFFTTRPPGEGSGMGLSVALGIVERAGGTIEVESEVGSGASFKVLLPLAESGCVGIEPSLSDGTGNGTD